MQKVMHSHPLADSAQLPGRFDPKDEWEMIQQEIDKDSWVHVAKRHQAPGIHLKQNDGAGLGEGVFRTGQDINLKTLCIYFDKVNFSALGRFQERIQRRHSDTPGWQYTVADMTIGDDVTAGRKAIPRMQPGFLLYRTNRGLRDSHMTKPPRGDGRGQAGMGRFLRFKGINPSAWHMLGHTQAGEAKIRANVTDPGCRAQHCGA